MRSSFAILCVWICFSVDASTPNGCSVIPEVENAEVSQSSRKDNYSDGDILDYDCKHGYASPKMITYICRDDNWTKSHDEKCSQVMCVANLTVNMRSDVTEDGHPGPEVSVRPGQTIILSCVGRGTKLQGQSKITCSPSGEWNVPFPKCVVRGCSVIPEVENAEVSQSSRKDNYSDGDKLDYDCKHGYASPQKITYICSKNKWTKWRGDECSLKRCELPEDIPNGRYTILSGSNFVFGTTIKYICRDGYQMMSRFDTRTCRDGGWDNQLPACEEAICVANLPVNMRSDGHPGPEVSVRPGHTITLSCVGKGINLQGQSKITCSPSGEWNVPFPKCVRGCSVIPEVENAEVSQSSRKDNYSDGDILVYDCKHGYASPKKITYICSKNKWTKWRGDECSLKRCELPEDIPNGRYTILSGSNFVFGTTIKYICRDGYQMMSRFDTRTCRDGGWDNQLPACEEVSCVPDKTEENMRVEGLPDYDELIKYGHRLTFSCVAGHILQGQTEITCQSDGQWSSPFPKCVEAICVANLPVNMRSDGHPGPEVSVRPGHTITLSCVERGTNLQGQSKITCSPSGEWNVPFPKCVVRGKCGPPPQVDSADTREMTKTEYNSRERVEYICFNKYTLDLRHPYSTHLTCEQGEWRGNIKCLKPCSVSVEDMDKRGIELRWGGREKIFSSHQDRITFACQRGKYLIGSEPLIQYCNNGVMILPECVRRGE